MRKIVRGSTDNSYGIEVARMAGMPNEVIERAREIMSGLERKDVSFADRSFSVQENMQISLFDEVDSRLKTALQDLDLERLTPIEALLELEKLQKLLRGHS